MARRKNVKRIDPRYFLNETVLREGDGAELAQAGEEALAELGEEEILAQLADLPPDIRAQIEAAATATAEDASQELALSEASPMGPAPVETYRQRADRESREMGLAGGAAWGGAGLAGVFGGLGAKAMGLAALNVVGVASGAAAVGIPVGILVAGVAILASRAGQSASPTAPQIDDEGTDAWERGQEEDILSQRNQARNPPELNAKVRARRARIAARKKGK